MSTSAHTHTLPQVVTSRAWPARHPEAATRLSATALLLTGYAVAWVIHLIWFRETAPFAIASGVSTFAVLFLLALAIERLIQPFAPSLGPDTSESKEKLRMATTGAHRAQAQKEIDDGRDKTALVTWGAAAGLGFLLSSALNVTMLGAILERGQRPWYWIDLLVTGLVLGAGTKPLNDLVTRLQDKDKK